MRALRVVGLDDDGAVICECPDNGERFALPTDDRLRAAARGDLPRLGQIDIELENQMRPREIQARIRAGASVEQLAEAAGVPVERIDRFAYPVLLERSRYAELAQLAHPVRSDGPDVQTLGEVVANTFSLRGNDYSEATWDSWRGEDGKWVVQLAWKAGRSDNRAHWIYHPGAHGGTVTTLDELAIDLVDPDAGVPLRTVRPVTALAEQALRVEEPPRRVERPERAEPAAASPQEEPTGVESGPAAETVEEAADQATGTTESAPGRRGRRNHPIVPSWEDVLLGVRSNR